MSSTNTAPYPQAVAVQALSVVAILISLPPLALHWKNRNFPASCLIFWFLLTNLFNIINAAIWNTDDIGSWWNGAGLCDVEVKLMIASYVGIPGALACIFRSLAYVLDTRRATLVPTKSQRFKNRVVELLFCVMVPIIALLLHLVYQGNRYFIFAITGCLSSLDQSWVSLVLGYIWPLVICLIASYYCGLVLYRLHRYRSDFGDILRSANSGLSKSRFLRLFLLSFIMLLAILPLQMFVVYKNIKVSLPMHPYSWDNLHGVEWSRIDMVPTGGKVHFDRWIPVAAGFMLFFSFGCGRDATKMYHSGLRFLGLDWCFKGVPLSSTNSLPPNTLGSSGSRARLVFHKDHKGKARNNRNESVNSSSTAEGSMDLEKGATCSRNSDGLNKGSLLMNPLSWVKNSFPSRHEKVPSAPRVAGPSGTLSTNAWAGSSQSRGSLDFEGMPSRPEFIRVKQVIKQESEMQV